ISRVLVLVAGLKILLAQLFEGTRKVTSIKGQQGTSDEQRKSQRSIVYWCSWLCATVFLFFSIFLLFFSSRCFFCEFSFFSNIFFIFFFGPVAHKKETHQVLEFSVQRLGLWKICKIFKKRAETSELG